MTKQHPGDSLSSGQDQWCMWRSQDSCIVTEFLFLFAFGLITRRLYSRGSSADTFNCDLIPRLTLLILKVQLQHGGVELDHAEACRSGKIILCMTG